MTSLAPSNFGGPPGGSPVPPGIGAVPPEIAERLRDCALAQTQLLGEGGHIDVAAPWAGDRHPFPVMAEPGETGGALAARLLADPSFAGASIDSLTLLSSTGVGADLRRGLSGHPNSPRVYEASGPLALEPRFAISAGGHWVVHGGLTSTHELAIAYELVQAQRAGFRYAASPGAASSEAGHRVPIDDRAGTLRLLGEALAGAVPSDDALDLARAVAAAEHPGLLWSALMGLLHGRPPADVPAEVRRLFATTGQPGHELATLNLGGSTASGSYAEFFLTTEVNRVLAEVGLPWAALAEIEGVWATLPDAAADRGNHRVAAWRVAHEIARRRDPGAEPRFPARPGLRGGGAGLEIELPVHVIQTPTAEFSADSNGRELFLDERRGVRAVVESAPMPVTESGQMYDQRDAAESSGQRTTRIPLNLVELTTTKFAVLPGESGIDSSVALSGLRHYVTALERATEFTPLRSVLDPHVTVREGAEQAHFVGPADPGRTPGSGRYWTHISVGVPVQGLLDIIGHAQRIVTRDPPGGLLPTGHSYDAKSFGYRVAGLYLARATNMPRHMVDRAAIAFVPHSVTLRQLAGAASIAYMQWATQVHGVAGHLGKNNTLLILRNHLQSLRESLPAEIRGFLSRSADDIIERAIGMILGRAGRRHDSKAIRNRSLQTPSGATVEDFFLAFLNPAGIAVPREELSPSQAIGAITDFRELDSDTGGLAGRGGRPLPNDLAVVEFRNIGNGFLTFDEIESEWESIGRLARAVDAEATTRSLLPQRPDFTAHDNLLRRGLSAFNLGRQFYTEVAALLSGAPVHTLEVEVPGVPSRNRYGNILHAVGQWADNSHSPAATEALRNAIALLQQDMPRELPATAPDEVRRRRAQWHEAADRAQGILAAGPRRTPTRGTPTGRAPTRRAPAGRTWTGGARASGDAYLFAAETPSDATAEEIAAAYPWLDVVNPYRPRGAGETTEDPFTLNCVITSIATDLALAEGVGHQAGGVATPIGPADPRGLPESDLAAYQAQTLGRPDDWSRVHTFDDLDAVREVMSAAPPGSRGIVLVRQPGVESAHAFNVVHDHNGVNFLDGQQGSLARQPSQVSEVAFLPLSEDIRIPGRHPKVTLSAQARVGATRVKRRDPAPVATGHAHRVTIALINLHAVLDERPAWAPGQTLVNGGPSLREAAAAFGLETAGRYASQLAGAPVSSDEVASLRHVESVAIVRGYAGLAFMQAWAAAAGGDHRSPVRSLLPLSEVVDRLSPPSGDPERTPDPYTDAGAGAFLRADAHEFRDHLSERLGEFLLRAIAAEEIVLDPPEAARSATGPVRDPAGPATIEIELLNMRPRLAANTRRPGPLAELEERHGPRSTNAVRLHNHARTPDGRLEIDRAVQGLRGGRQPVQRPDSPEHLAGAPYRLPDGSRVYLPANVTPAVRTWLLSQAGRAPARLGVVTVTGVLNDPKGLLHDGIHGVTPEAMLEELLLLPPGGAGEEPVLVLRIDGQRWAADDFARRVQAAVDGNRLRGRPTPPGIVYGLVDRRRDTVAWQVVTPGHHQLLPTADLDRAVAVARGTALPAIDPQREIRARIRGYPDHPQLSTAEIVQLAVDRDSTGPDSTGPALGDGPLSAMATELRVPIPPGAGPGEIMQAARSWLKPGVAREVVSRRPDRESVPVRLGTGLQARILRLPATAAGPQTSASVVETPGFLGNVRYRVWVNRYRTTPTAAEPDSFSAGLLDPAVDWSILDELPPALVRRLTVEPGRLLDGRLQTADGTEMTASEYVRRLPEVEGHRPIVVFQEPLKDDSQGFLDELSQKALVVVSVMQGNALTPRQPLSASRTWTIFESTVTGTPGARPATITKIDPNDRNPIASVLRPRIRRSARQPAQASTGPVAVRAPVAPGHAAELIRGYLRMLRGLSRDGAGPANEPPEVRAWRLFRVLVQPGSVPEYLNAGGTSLRNGLSKWAEMYEAGFRPANATLLNRLGADAVTPVLAGDQVWLAIGTEDPRHPVLQDLAGEPIDPDELTASRRIELILDPAARLVQIDVGEPGYAFTAIRDEWGRAQDDTSLTDLVSLRLSNSGRTWRTGDLAGQLARQVSPGVARRVSRQVTSRSMLDAIGDRILDPGTTPVDESARRAELLDAIVRLLADTGVAMSSDEIEARLDAGLRTNPPAWVGRAVPDELVAGMAARVVAHGTETGAPVVPLPRPGRPRRVPRQGAPRPDAPIGSSRRIRSGDLRIFLPGQHVETVLRTAFAVPVLPGTIAVAAMVTETDGWEVIHDDRGELAPRDLVDEDFFGSAAQDGTANPVLVLHLVGDEVLAREFARWTQDFAVRELLLGRPAPRGVALAVHNPDGAPTAWYAGDPHLKTMMAPMPSLGDAVAHVRGQPLSRLDPLPELLWRAEGADPDGRVFAPELAELAARQAAQTALSMAEVRVPVPSGADRFVAMDTARMWLDPEQVRELPPPSGDRSTVTVRMGQGLWAQVLSLDDPPANILAVRPDPLDIVKPQRIWINQGGDAMTAVLLDSSLDWSVLDRLPRGVFTRLFIEPAQFANGRLQPEDGPPIDAAAFVQRLPGTGDGTPIIAFTAARRTDGDHRLVRALSLGRHVVAATGSGWWEVYRNGRRMRADPALDGALREEARGQTLAGLDTAIRQLGAGHLVPGSDEVQVIRRAMHGRPAWRPDVVPAWLPLTAAGVPAGLGDLLRDHYPAGLAVLSTGRPAGSGFPASIEIPSRFVRDLSGTLVVDLHAMAAAGARLGGNGRITRPARTAPIAPPQQQPIEHRPFDVTGKPVEVVIVDDPAHPIRAAEMLHRISERRAAVAGASHLRGLLVVRANQAHEDAYRRLAVDFGLRLMLPRQEAAGRPVVATWLSPDTLVSVTGWTVTGRTATDPTHELSEPAVRLTADNIARLFRAQPAAAVEGADRTPESVSRLRQMVVGAARSGAGSFAAALAAARFPAGLRLQHGRGSDVTDAALWVQERLENPDLRGVRLLRNEGDLRGLIAQSGSGGMVIVLDAGRPVVYTRSGADVWRITVDPGGGGPLEPERLGAGATLLIEPAPQRAVAFNKCEEFLV